MPTFAFTGRSLPTGVTTLGPVVVLASWQSAALTLDVTNQPAPGLVLDVQFSTDGGAHWATVAKADYNGPWLDRLGTLQNSVDLRYGTLQLPSGQLRVVVTNPVAPFTTSGGSITVS